MTALGLATGISLLSAPLWSQAHGHGRKTVKVRGRDAVANEVLIRMKDTVSASAQTDLDAQIDAEEDDQLGAGIRRLRSRRFDADALESFLRTHPSVEYAEPNWIVRATAIPNDTQFPKLWALRNVGQRVNNGESGESQADIHGTRAWDLTTGSRRNVVAVVDTGVDYTHPDLAANIWSAPAAFTVTIAGVSIKCAAGTHGFNAIARSCDPRDDNNHGTHVAGTIGAVGNNRTGVAGVNWTASIMALKFLDGTGTGTTADAINAMEFAMQAKSAFAASSGANVRVLSNSWNGGGFSQALLDAIKKTSSNNMLFVASAGNDGSSNDVTPSYPAAYAASNVIAVAASDNGDQLAGFSNYGKSVHLAAPGVNVLSTTRSSGYKYMSGTSMAVPHVSGAAALVLSRCVLDTAAVKSNLLANVDVLGSLSGWVRTNGRLNVDRAVRACATTAAMNAPAPPTSVKATSGPAAGDIGITWAASSGATGYRVKRSRLSTGPFSTIQTVTRTSYVNGSLTSGRRYYYVVTALAGTAQSGDSSTTSAVAK